MRKLVSYFLEGLLNIVRIDMTGFKLSTQEEKNTFNGLEIVFNTIGSNQLKDLLLIYFSVNMDDAMQIRRTIELIVDLFIDIVSNDDFDMFFIN